MSFIYIYTINITHNYATRFWSNVVLNLLLVPERVITKFYAVHIYNINDTFWELKKNNNVMPKQSETVLSLTFLPDSWVMITLLQTASGSDRAHTHTHTHTQRESQYLPPTKGSVCLIQGISWTSWIVGGIEYCENRHTRAHWLTLMSTARLCPETYFMNNSAHIIVSCKTLLESTGRGLNVTEWSLCSTQTSLTEHSDKKG